MSTTVTLYAYALRIARSTQSGSSLVGLLGCWTHDTLHVFHLGILWVRVRQNGSARGGNGRLRGDVPDVRGRLEDGYFFLLAFLLGLDNGNVFSGIVEGRADLGLLVLVGHSLGGLEFFHQVVDLGTKGLLAVADFAVQEHDVRLLWIEKKLPTIINFVRRKRQKKNRYFGRHTRSFELNPGTQSCNVVARKRPYSHKQAKTKTKKF
jgi:hypothetical protein